MFKSIIPIAALAGLLFQPQSVVAETYVCSAKSPSAGGATFVHTYERVKGGFNESVVTFYDNSEPHVKGYEPFYGDMPKTRLGRTYHLIERKTSLTFLTYKYYGLDIQYIDLEEMEFQATGLNTASHELKRTTVAFGTCVRGN